MRQMIISGPARGHTRPPRLRVVIKTGAIAPSTGLPDTPLKPRHHAIIAGSVLVLVAIAVLATAVLAVGLTLFAIVAVLSVWMSVVAAMVTRMIGRRRWRSRSG